MPSFRGKFLRIRLFLEGIEVPVISAQVQTAPNSPSAASIQIPPSPEANRFLPRTLVHLFYWDEHAAASTHLRSDVTDPEGAAIAREKLEGTLQQALVEDTNDSTILANVENQHYKLLFVGELVGFQSTKSATDRSIVLQCFDLSSYWDTAQQWENTDLFGPGYKAMISGGATNLFTDFLSSKDEEIIRRLMTPSASYPGLKGLLGGIVHLLEGIGGYYWGEKVFSGQNIFFSLAELRLRISQLITAYEKDPSAAQLLHAAGAEDLFGRVLGNLGEQVSFREAINALMGVIFHETIAIPTPMYVPGTAGSVTGYQQLKYSKDPDTRAYVAYCQSARAGLEQVRSTVISYVPPTEVLAVDRRGRKTSKTFTDKEHADALEAKRVRLDVVEKLLAHRDTLKSMASAMAANSKKARSQGLAPIATAFGAGASKLPQISLRIQQLAQGTKNAAGMQNQIQKTIDEVLAYLKTIESGVHTKGKKGKVRPARLNQQIFRPDVWYTAPPKCNVIFPEHTMSVVYARNFLQEPTRLLLKTHEAFFGEDELFDQFFFAPKALTTKTEKRNLQAVLTGDVMAHELFTGILPVFEKMADTAIFALKGGSTDKALKKVGLAQTTANFMYFKYRFAARQMQVTSRFNPYIAPGFPGLVIDKYIDEQKLTEYANLLKRSTGIAMNVRDFLGAHYLGSFSSVTHSVSQGSPGTTTISVTYGRDFNESVEFLGAIEHDQVVKAVVTGKGLEPMRVAALAPPVVGDFGPNHGVIQSVLDVTSSYAEENNPPPELPFYQGRRRKNPYELATKVAVATPKTARQHGMAVEAYVGSATEVVTFRAYEIQEEVPNYRRTKIDMPAEKYIQPGWYGECWNTKGVGEVYGQFFGVGSICDPIAVGEEQTELAPQHVEYDGKTSTVYVDQLDATEKGYLTADQDLDQLRSLLNLPSGSSIAQAVEFLVLLYSYTKKQPLDVEEFIYSYTWRPIASMVDLFGSQNLALDSEGHEVVRGIEGFHSRAFGNWDDLFGLVPPQVESILDMKKATMQAAKADVRGRRWRAIYEYAGRLGLAHAVIG